MHCIIIASRNIFTCFVPQRRKINKLCQSQILNNFEIHEICILHVSFKIINTKCSKCLLLKENVVLILAKFNEDLNSLLICDVKFVMNRQPQLQQSTYFVIAFLNIICELSFSTQFKFSEFTLNVNFIWCL